MSKVIILGSGVIGLSAAIRLVEEGFTVTIIARDLPTDLESQDFASPWAGADWHSFVTAEDDRQCRWETLTFKKIWNEYCKDVVQEGDLAMRVPAFVYFDKEPEPAWYKDLCPGYRRLESSELPEGPKYGVTFQTWTLSAPYYIQQLYKRCQELGVRFVKQTVHSIEEPFLLEDCLDVDVVVNATALGSRTLKGVEDDKVHPVRGQTVLIRAPGYRKDLAYATGEGAARTVTYVIPRPNGDCILGGIQSPNDWNLSADSALTSSIISRCLALDPSLASTNASKSSEFPVDVIQVNVGLRPARIGGARCEREKRILPDSERLVNIVHAYGLAGAGFQASWGVAEDVVELVKQCFVVGRTRC